MNDNQKGCYAEYVFCTVAMKNNFNVSMPLLGASHYDCIIEKNGKLFKIQIKFISKDRIKSNYNKYSEQCVLRAKGRFYNKQDVDFFALYHQQLDGFFIIPNIEQKTIRIRANGPYKENFNNFALIS